MKKEPPLISAINAQRAILQDSLYDPHAFMTSRVYVGKTRRRFFPTQ